MQIGTAKPDPAMGNKATQFDNDSVGNPAGQQSPYQGITKARAISTWAKGVGAAAVNCSVFGGGTENCYARFRFDASMGAGYVNVTKTVWNRLSYTFPADVTDALVFDTKNQPAGAGVISGQTSFLAFGAQAEKANYPSSYIPTTNATVTRETEELMIPGTKLATIIPNKYFELTIRFAPNFADTELSTDYHLFQIHDGEKWRIYLKASSKQVIVVLNNGTYITSDPITFSREQELEIHLKNLQGMLVELTIGGATTGSGTFMSAMNGIAATNNVDTFILSHHDGAEECSDLRFFELK